MFLIAVIEKEKKIYKYDERNCSKGSVVTRGRKAREFIYSKKYLLKHHPVWQGIWENAARQIIFLSKIDEKNCIDKIRWGSHWLKNKWSKFAESAGCRWKRVRGAFGVSLLGIIKVIPDNQLILLIFVSSLYFFLGLNSRLSLVSASILLA